MNIGFISTRLAGNDGVSLETTKWAAATRRLGHEVFYCAGELESDGPPGMLVPEMHFTTSENMWIRSQAYGNTEPHPELMTRIERLRARLKTSIETFLAGHKIDLIVPQNIFAIPLQIPLALALTDVVAETNIPTVAHHHDFYWERDFYEPNCVQHILDQAFPPDLPSIRHVVINSLAQRSVKNRRGLESVVVPNVFDFATPPPGIDEFNADLRAAIGLTRKDVFILQPVRIIPRKGIELAVELVERLGDPRCKLVLTHGDDVDHDYLHQLEAQAQRTNVDLRLISDRISTDREIKDGQKTYVLWDAYVHADFVTYPSLYEGFGNALLEAVYFRKPMLVNRYPVYAADIGPLGFEFVEIDGQVTDDAVAKVEQVLADPVLSQRMVERNYQLGVQHFSLVVLASLLQDILADLPPIPAK
jgi:glycosyltransferase involved in cell wall biosynthesis